jgi:rSAM/selenodomain-associated transferase 1
MAKAPVPGLVKTRLCPPLTLEGAATLARAALEDTLAAVAAADVAQRSVVLDGRVGTWLPTGIRVIAQRSGPFADRLEAAMMDAWTEVPLPIVLVGMDTPQMNAGHIESAAQSLLGRDTDAVLGHAEDGGFWIIGVRRPVAGLFAGVPMSTSEAGTAQLARLTVLQLRCARLPRLRDVDLFTDALAVARDAPDTRFAAALDACLVNPLTTRALESVGFA